MKKYDGYLLDSPYYDPLLGEYVYAVIPERETVADHIRQAFEDGEFDYIPETAYAGKLTRYTEGDQVVEKIVPLCWPSDKFMTSACWDWQQRIKRETKTWGINEDPPSVKEKQSAKL